MLPSLPYDPATQAVALVTPGGGATVTTPDGTGTAVFPAGTRDASYYVRIGQGTNDCARDAPDGDHHVYVTVEIFDLAGNLEEDVTLDQPVTILLRIDSADLGGLETAQAIYQHDGIRVYTRDDSGEEWTDVDFTWAPSDTGIITVFITGITNFQLLCGCRRRQRPAPASRSGDSDCYPDANAGTDARSGRRAGDRSGAASTSAVRSHRARA